VGNFNVTLRSSPAIPINEIVKHLYLQYDNEGLIHVSSHRKTRSEIMPSFYSPLIRQTGKAPEQVTLWWGKENGMRLGSAPCRSSLQVRAERPVSAEKHAAGDKFFSEDGMSFSCLFWQWRAGLIMLLVAGPIEYFLMVHGYRFLGGSLPQGLWVFRLAVGLFVA